MYTIIAFIIANLSFQLQGSLPDVFWIAIGLFLSISLFVWRKNMPAKVMLAFALGYIYTYSYAIWHTRPFIPADVYGQAITVVGKVDSLPLRSPNTTKFNFKLQQIQGKYSQSLKHPTLLRLNWNNAPARLKIGQEWQLILKIKQPHTNANPGSFDTEAWLMTQPYRAYARVVGKEAVLLAEHNWSNPIEQLRQHIAIKITKLLPKQSNRALIMALALGTKHQLSAEDLAAFQATGTSHLIAISGLHIGLVFAFMFSLAKVLLYLRPKLLLRYSANQLSAIAGLAAAIVYAGLAGFTVPTVRALIMLSIFVLAGFMHKAVPLWRRFTLALFAVLIIQPMASLNPGFWLSFVAVAVIIYATNFKLDNNKKTWLDWLHLQAVVVLGLTPLTIAIFKQAPLIAPIANLICIPIFSFLIVPLTLLAVISLFIVPDIAQQLLQLNDAIIGLFKQILFMLGQIPGNYWLPANHDMLSLCFAAAGVMLLLAPKGFPLRMLGLIGFLPLISANIPELDYGAAKVAVLDVGQGLGVVVQTQHHNLIFDAGNKVGKTFDAGTQFMLPYLQQKGVKNIDKIIISHADLDHRGGLATILTNYPDTQVLTSVPAVLKEAEAGKCYAGQHWSWDGVEFEIIYPERRSEGSKNNLSCVLLVKSQAAAVMLTGDIEAPAEKSLVASQQNLHAEVLLAPHHGSKTSSSAEFIEAVDPQYVVYPAGFANRWGFPKPEIVARYAKHGVKQISTAEKGAVMIKLTDDKPGFEVKGYRDLWPHYWYSLLQF